MISSKADPLNNKFVIGDDDHDHNNYTINNSNWGIEKIVMLQGIQLIVTYFQCSDSSIAAHCTTCALTFISRRSVKLGGICPWIHKLHVL